MIYTVVLNSSYYAIDTPSLTNRGIRKYGIDWSFLPQGKKYKVSFSFNSEFIVRTDIGLADETVVQVYIDFTASPNVYEAGSTISRKVSNFVGLIALEFVQWDTASAEKKFVARWKDNPPIYLNDRPSNNIFTVTLTDIYGVAFDMDNNYLLTLQFEELDE